MSRPDISLAIWLLDQPGSLVTNGLVNEVDPGDGTVLLKRRCECLGKRWHANAKNVWKHRAFAS